jgi:hypothetical protein
MINVETALKSEAIDVSVADQTISIVCHAIYCGASGTIVGRLVGDAADSTWSVIGGTYLHGAFTVIRKTGTTPASGVFRAVQKYTD